MKKLTAFAVFIVLAFALVSCGQESDTPAGMKEASTDAAVFDMFVPEGWIVDLQTGAVSAHVSERDRSNVSVMAWGLGDKDGTVDDWWDIHQDEIKNVLSDVSEVEIENSTLGGIAAKKYTYTASVGGAEYKYMQLASVKDGSVFVLTYTAVPDSFDENLEDVMSVAKELRYR